MTRLQRSRLMPCNGILAACFSWATIARLTHLKAGTPQVKFDPDVVGVRTLLRLVDRDLGYPARLEGDLDSGGGGDPSEADRRFWLCRFCWGALLAVPTFFLAMVGALTGSLLHGGHRRKIGKPIQVSCNFSYIAAEDFTWQPWPHGSRQFSLHTRFGLLAAKPDA